jgi:hypothetical protein
VPPSTSTTTTATPPSSSGNELCVSALWALSSEALSTSQTHSWPRPRYDQLLSARTSGRTRRGDANPQQTGQSRATNGPTAAELASYRAAGCCRNRLKAAQQVIDRRRS